jgi:cysteine desulfurase
VAAGFLSFYAPDMRPIYLDSQATTPVDPAVLAAMLPYFTEYFGNPSSTTHQYGWEAAAAVSKARETIASAIAATPEEIVFTSGATEANNLAIKGVAESYFDRGRHIVTIATEHNAVLDPCRYLESLGFEVTYLPVDSLGEIDLDLLADRLRQDTILVSVMAANNEIGTLHPLGKIGKMCHDREIIFHTDAAQAIGKISLDVNEQYIDLMSLTAHKIYGPKGIGALYIRRRDPRVKISPQLHGGSHERGWRSGTLYSPQIVGFGKAIELAVASQSLEAERLTLLRDRLWQELQQLEDVYLNGHSTNRLPGNLNVSFGGINGNALLLALRDTVALSSGAACSSAKIAPSHVLTSLGRDAKLAFSSLRFGLGKSTTSEEVDRVAAATISAVNSLRKIAGYN